MILNVGWIFGHGDSTFLNSVISLNSANFPGPSGTEIISTYYKLLDPPKINKNRVEEKNELIINSVFLVKKRTKVEKTS